MRLVPPVAITDAALISSTVAEADAPAWASGTTYALGDRAMRAHRVYESLIGGNIGNVPGAGTEWIDLGPTNRWAMFDRAAGQRTASSSAIAVTIEPGVAVDTLGLLDVDAASMQVVVTVAGDPVYDETLPAGIMTLALLDLPAPAGARITVTITPAPGQDATIGKLIVGTAIDLGDTETGPTIGINDYSRRETDDFGVTTVVERAWSRRIALRSRIDSSMADTVQRHAAAWRAKPALWIGDPGFEVLTAYGFYKDFSVDLQLGTISYCSLTIEGLPSAETSVPVIDPAIEGVSDLRVVRPQPVTPAMLTASNVPENDYAAWSAGTTYATGARVISTATHRVYESVVDANIGNDPTAGATQWLEVGPTNRWAMFDQALGTATSRAGSIIVNLKPDADVTALAVLDVEASSVRVQATGYDETLSPGDAGSATFLDLAVAADSTIVVTITGAQASAGTLLLGTLEPLGVAEVSPTIGINDYSRKETDAFGNTEPIERAWAKRMSARSLVATAALDNLVRRVASLRAKPALWIGNDGFDSLTIYGFFRDFSAEVSERTSLCSFNIEGLSKAAILEPAKVSWPDIVDDDPAHPKPDDGATVGAPDGTPVGDRPAEQVIADLDQLEIDAGIAQTTAANAQSAAANALSVAQQAEQDIINVGADLQQLGSDLTGQIDQLSADITAAGGDISTLQSTVSTQGSAITANATAISNAVGDLATLTSVVSAQGSAITTNATAISTLDTNVATLTTRVTTGNPNLLRNSTGENGFVGWVGGSGYSTTALNRNGSYFAHAANQGTGTFVLNSDLFPLTPGIYTIAYETQNSGSGVHVHCDVLCYDAGNAVILNSGNNAAGSGTQFSDRSDRALTFTAPAGAVNARVRIVVVKTDTAQIARIRRIKLEAGSVWTPYSQEASIVQQATAISTLDTQYASLSSTVSTQGSSITTNATAISSLQGNYASLSSTVSTQGTTITANATAISTLQGNYASLSSTVSTQGSTISSQATAITTLQGNVSTLQSTVSTQGSAITTNATAISTLNTDLATLTTRVTAGNPNLLPNSSGENGLNGWFNTAGFTTNYNINGPYFTHAANQGTGTFFCNAAAITAAAGVYTISYETQNTGAAGIIVYSDVMCLDASDNVLLDSGQNGATIGTNFDDRAQRAFTFTAPAGTAKLLLRLVVDKTDTNQVARWRRIKLERGSTFTAYTQEAAVQQQFQAINTLDTNMASLSTTVSVQGVTVTSHTSAISTINGNVTTLFGKAGVTVDVNGRITGWALNNNGQTGQMKVHADYFSIEKPGGGPRTEYSDGTWRVYAGSIMTVWGAGFGSSNQFVEWTGPTQSSLSNCTEANAVKYVKTNGSAYFGGSLSAGTLTTKAGTSSLSATAEAETAQFGSNGGQIVVTLSYSFNVFNAVTYSSAQGAAWTTAKNAVTPAMYNTGGVNWKNDPSADPGPTYVDLYRSVNGAGYAFVARLSLTGSNYVTGEQPLGGDPGNMRYFDSAGGSLTYTDPDLNTNDRQYKAVLVSRGNKYLAGSVTQNISIICVEE